MWFSSRLGLRRSTSARAVARRRHPAVRTLPGRPASGPGVFRGGRGLCNLPARPRAWGATLFARARGGRLFLLPSVDELWNESIAGYDRLGALAACRLLDAARASR